MQLQPVTRMKHHCPITQILKLENERVIQHLPAIKEFVNGKMEVFELEMLNADSDRWNCCMISV